MKMLKTLPVPPVQAEPRVQAGAGVPAAVTAPAAALQQAHSLLGLLAQAALRQAGNAGASAVLPTLLARPEAGAELLELQAALAERLLQLQQGWWAGWTAWLEEVGQLRRADTLSEHMEQLFNLGAQFGALLQAQGGDLVDLQDTVQVDYGYWVARKLGAVS